MYSLQLTHPFGLLVSGGTKTGKRTFVKKLLGNVQVMIDRPPENIKYFYSEYQDTFAEIKSLVPNIEFIEGVPDVIFDSINPKTRNLYIFDDMMGERDSVIAKLFTKKSHHGNLSHRIEINQKVHSRRNLSQFHMELNKCSAVRYMFPSFKRTYAIFQQERAFQMDSK